MLAVESDTRNNDQSISLSGTASQSSLGSNIPKTPVLSDSFPAYKSN